MSGLPHASHWLPELSKFDAVFALLDYDGTLCPIVEDPATARPSEAMRSALKDLLVHPRVQVAVVSGRASDKVLGFLNLPADAHILVAGSHGFHIAGTTLAGTSLRNTTADGFLPALAAARDALSVRLRGIPGASVEDNRYSVTAHWRRVDPARVPEVEAAVDAALAEAAGGTASAPGGAGTPVRLAKRPGKCVFEIRPALDWHKGAAASWLAERVLPEMAASAAAAAGGGGAAVVPRVAVVAIGDDHTDEDMFRALRELTSTAGSAAVEQGAAGRAPAAAGAGSGQPAQPEGQQSGHAQGAAVEVGGAEAEGYAAAAAAEHAGVLIRLPGGRDARVLALPILVAEPVARPASSLASPTLVERRRAAGGVGGLALMPRPTAAAAWLEDPEDVRLWLVALQGALGSSGGRAVDAAGASKGAPVLSAAVARPAQHGAAAASEGHADGSA